MTSRFPYPSNEIHRSEPTEDCGLSAEAIHQREAEWINRWKAATTRASAALDLETQRIIRRTRP